METLTRLVAESLARHGFDRPVDYRRLEWSRWFRCESHHSLLVVPSKPGVFALAEEIMSAITDLVETAASAITKGRISAPYPTVEEPRFSATSAPHTVEERRFSAALVPQNAGALAPAALEPARMLAVTHFFDDDDMAFVLDRMLSYQNPMRARLASGRYFVRYVVITDPSQRRSICNALNQWIASSAEKATGIGTHFASSLELAHPTEPTHVETAATAVQATAKPSATTTEHVRMASSPVLRPGIGPVERISNPKQNDERRVNSAPQLNSAVATNIHCSSSFPSGF